MINRYAYNDVIAIVPVYADGIGDVVEIYTSNGKRIEEVKLKSYIERMCRYHFIDYYAMRKKYGGILEIKNLVPIPMGDDVLVPFKARRCISANDSSFGYYSLKMFESVSENATGTLIRMRNGIAIPSIGKIGSTKKHLGNAKAIYMIGR